MTITIIQTCDSGGETRDLSLETVLGNAPFRSGLETTDGWVALGHDKHICPHCISFVVNEKVGKDKPEKYEKQKNEDTETFVEPENESIDPLPFVEFPAKPENEDDN